DRDHLVRLPLLERPRLRKVGGEPPVGLLADRARVEDEHVRLLLDRCLSQAELLEHAFDPLGVVGVHLAAERRDVVPAHAKSLAAVQLAHESAFSPRATWAACWFSCWLIPTSCRIFRRSPAFPALASAPRTFRWRRANSRSCAACDAISGGAFSLWMGFRIASS